MIPSLVVELKLSLLSLRYFHFTIDWKNKSTVEPWSRYFRGTGGLATLRGTGVATFGIYQRSQIFNVTFGGLLTDTTDKVCDNRFIRNTFHVHMYDNSSIMKQFSLIIVFSFKRKYYRLRKY